jgi:hypothetical protein
VQVAFGELFHGESSTRTLALVNSGPTEARYDLSYGSLLDMQAVLADDDGSGSGPASDDPLSAFLQVSRARVSAIQLSSTLTPGPKPLCADRAALP